MLTNIYDVIRVLCMPVVSWCRLADITFFGEALPARFHRRRLTDLANADLLIVMGTSLLVQPFASMIGESQTRACGRGRGCGWFSSSQPMCTVVC